MYRDGYHLGIFLFVTARTYCFAWDLFGGASRDRTDGLVVANDALSQLSYSPTMAGTNYFLIILSAFLEDTKLHATSVDQVVMWGQPPPAVRPSEARDARTA